MLIIISSFWKELVYIFFEMSPYLLGGLLLAGVLRSVVPQGAINRIAGHRGAGISPLMSIIGVPLPLCSCSVLPFAVELRRQGASRGAVSSFLTSTPQTGVDSIMVSYSFFGLPFALYKVAAAFVSGTISGWFVTLFGSGEEESDNRDRRAPEAGSAEECFDDCCRTVPAGEKGDVREYREDDCCGPGDGCDDNCSDDEPAGGAGSGTGISLRERIKHIFTYAYGTLLGDFAVVFILGIVASAAIGAFLPPELLEGIGRTWIYYPAILAVSLPLYICATASVPIAFALMQSGIPPGAAMILLIAGPATNIATLGVVGKTLGKRATIVYVLTVVVSAVAAGLLFDRFFTPGLGGLVRPGFELPRPVQVSASAVLALLLLFHTVRAIIRKWRSFSRRKSVLE